MPFSDTTILIKTIERPLCLRRLLRSIADLGFDGQVIVADDSREPYRREMLAEFAQVVTKYLNLPYDTGCSAGRNAALAEVETDYFVLCDDDFVLDHRTRLDWMRDVVRDNPFELLGGLVFESGWTRRYAGRLVIADGVVTHEPVKYSPPFVYCDIVLNFFLAHTESIRAKVGGWNELLKTNEHSEFFFRAKRGGLVVGHTEESGVFHRPERTEAYDQLRHQRGEQYDQLCLRECGVHTWHYPGGEVAKLKSVSQD